MWSNFKITLVRGPHEYPIEQSKQTVKAKSSCQSQQRNANQSKASAHNMRITLAKCPFTSDYDPPCLAYFIVMMRRMRRRMMIQKVALKALKIGYV